MVYVYVCVVWFVSRMNAGSVVLGVSRCSMSGKLVFSIDYFSMYHFLSKIYLYKREGTIDLKVWLF